MPETLPVWLDSPSKQRSPNPTLPVMVFTGVAKLTLAPWKRRMPSAPFPEIVLPRVDIREPCTSWTPDNVLPTIVTSPRRSIAAFRSVLMPTPVLLE
ncbi:MAG: hypothetical protein HYU41_15465 [Candidatus Rokubacteria bacterium]|nr:hypothetical protein [Candidatus Rokubacteria bacterium]